MVAAISKRDERESKANNWAKEMTDKLNGREGKGEEENKGGGGVDDDDSRRRRRV